MRRVVGSMVLALVLLLPASPAQAHAAYVSSDPANGQTLTSAPATVRVTMSEPVTLLPGDDESIAAFDAAGRRVDAGAPMLSEDRRELLIPLRRDLPDGVYLVNWVIVSADSHPMGGSIQFGVNAPATFIESDAPRADPLIQLLAGLAKGAVYLALVVGLGAPAAAQVLGMTGPAARRVRRAALIGLAAASAASVVQVAVQFLWVQSSVGVDVLGNGHGTEPPQWGQFPTFLVSSFAVAAWLRVGVLAAAAVLLVLARREPAPRWEGPALGAGIVAAAATVAAAGHGGAGPAWRLVAVTAHGAGAIAWLGGLAVLGSLFLLRRLEAVQLRRLSTWSWYAAVAVGLILLSGLVQAAVQVRYPAALWTTAYGLVLSAKLVLVLAAGALGLGGWLWGRRERHRPEGVPAPGRTAQLRRRVLVELLVGVVIVALSGILSTLTPAQDDYVPTVSETTRIGPYEVEVTIVGARTGTQRVRIRAAPVEAETRPPSDASVTLSAANAGVAALPAEVVFRITDAVPFEEPTAVRFETAPVTAPVAGRWRALVTLVVDDWHQYSGAVEYDVEG